MKEKFLSRQQLDLLPERIRMAEETDASKELNVHLWNLYEENGFNPMNILVVGTGGSYPAAVFAKYALTEEVNTPHVEAVMPQTAIRMITQFDYISNCTWHPKYDLVIGISYSSKTPDIHKVYELCHKKGFPFILLTGAEKSALTGLYEENEIISYFNPNDTTGKEKGMISMMSTLAPIIVLDDNWTCKLTELNQNALTDAQTIVSGMDIQEIAYSLKKCPVIHVFYEWDTLATAADIESKFIESGIANVVLHEKKNFSHGRSTSLYNQDFALVINLTRNSSQYDVTLSNFLSALCYSKFAHYLEIGNSSFSVKDWNIRALSVLPYLITVLGEELNIDISKPLKPYPNEALTLYNYKGFF